MLSTAYILEQKHFKLDSLKIHHAKFLTEERLNFTKQPFDNHFVFNFNFYFFESRKQLLNKFLEVEN